MFSISNVKARRTFSMTRQGEEKKRWTRRVAGATGLVAALTLATTIVTAPATATGPTTVWSATSTQSASYARSLELKNNGAANGRLLATFETWSWGSPASNFPIYESQNSGTSWTQVGTVYPYDAALREQGFLYELPQTIGTMSAGTLLFAVNAFDDPLPEQAHAIELFKSTDLGRNWTYVSTVATGGAYAGATAASQGIWEPFLMVANNKLIVYYADEQDPNNNQMVVHRTSTNGVTWSSTVVDVALGTLRPGMPVITRLGNGTYLMSYEVVGNANDQVQIRYSTDGENWGTSTSPGTLVNYYRGAVPGSQPYVTWVPSGGPNGTVVLSTGRSDQLFLNYNNGTGTWDTQTAPIPKGYSRSVIALSSGDALLVGTVPSGTYPTNADVKSATTTVSASANALTNHWVGFANGNDLAMDLIGGITSDGARINQWAAAFGSPNQQWSLLPTGTGHFRIASSVNAKYATIQSNSTASGAHLVNMPLDETNTSQQWDFTDLGNGWFKIVNVRSGLVLEVASNSTANDAVIQQATYSGVSSQKWRIQPYGTLSIQAKQSGKYINIGGAGTTNGTQLVQYDYEAGNGWFNWTFDRTSDGWYKVSSAWASGKVADVVGISTIPGADVDIWDYLGNGGQQVRLVPQQDGSYKLVFKHDGQVWDIAGFSLANNAHLTQYTDNGTDNQRYYLER